ncbi:hypothetical protein EUGRSUZ_L01078 [Eucalyptus grandis]|uniref:Uncharacterized protein n=1 Tax=Eucalyptus grandis TaxID=71139 RepID=A0A058ZV78_EUCGR|nr:hypothetical protein EUGRSUZ_L01078 [Eucalyptus grandis]
MAYGRDTVPYFPIIVYSLSTKCNLQTIQARRLLKSSRSARASMFLDDEQNKDQSIYVSNLDIKNSSLHQLFSDPCQHGDAKWKNQNLTKQ